MAELKYRYSEDGNPLVKLSFDYTDDLSYTEGAKEVTVGIQYFSQTGSVFLTAIDNYRNKNYEAVLELQGEHLDNLIAALTLAKKYRSQLIPS